MENMDGMDSVAVDPGPVHLRNVPATLFALRAVVLCCSSPQLCTLSISSLHPHSN